MKTWTLVFRAVDRARFREVQNGLKLVETRAATKKYQSIQAGDTLRFVCGGSECNKKIKQVHHFDSITKLFKKIPLKKVMPDIDSIEAAKRRYATYPGYQEKIKKDGILAFVLEQ